MRGEKMPAGCVGLFQLSSFLKAQQEKQEKKTHTKDNKKTKSHPQNFCVRLLHFLYDMSNKSEKKQYLTNLTTMGV